LWSPKSLGGLNDRSITPVAAVKDGTLPNIELEAAQKPAKPEKHAPVPHHPAPHHPAPHHTPMPNPFETCPPFLTVPAPQDGYQHSSPPSDQRPDRIGNPKDGWWI